MEYEIYAIVWLYIFGAAGFGASFMQRQSDMLVFHFLLVVAWPVTMPLFLLLRLIVAEIFNR